MQTTFKKHYHLFIGLALFLISFVVYLTALSPTIQPRDNPDVVTAAVTLGIPHSPGYPLYTILGFIFSKIIPFGSLVWRVNFMSALFSAATIFLIYLIIFKITKKVLAALVGAAILAFSYNYFFQSLYADVLSLNNLLVALEIYVLLCWRGSKEPKYLYLWAFLFGLAFSHHQLSLIIAPAFLYFILATDKKVFTTWNLAKLVGFFTLGLIPWLYLPIRAIQNPVYSWGETGTWKGFWNFVTRQDYGGNDYSYLSFFYLRIWDWLASLSWKQFSLFGLILGVAGFYFARKEKPFIFNFFLILLIMSGPVFALFANVQPNPMEMASMERFFIFSFMLFSISIGLGIAWLQNFSPRFSWLLLVLPLMLVFFNYPEVDRSRAYYAYNLGQNIFKSLPENAVIFAGSDVPLFELWYLQKVENLRRDVRVLPGADKELIDLPDWLTKRLVKEFPDYQLPIAELAQKYPVYTNMNIELFWGDETKNFVVEGIVYRYLPDKNWLETFNGQKAQENLANYTYRGDYRIIPKTDILSQEILYNYANAWINLGITYHQKKMFDEAIQSYQKALEIGPNNIIAWTNLAGAFLDQGKYEEAKQEYKKILKKYPDSAQARNGLNLADKKLNE